MLHPEAGIAHIEQEPLPKHSILITGAGKGTGLELAKYFGLQGYHVIAGTRSAENFSNLRRSVLEQGGIAPTPFITDITDPNALNKAFTELNLKPGEPVHHFALAAGGLSLTGSVGRELAKLKIAEKKGTLNREMLEEATGKIRDIVESGDASLDAFNINHLGAMMVSSLLLTGDHLKKGSVSLTLSSSISDSFDLSDESRYPGPQFYRPIAESKQCYVRDMEKLAKIFGFSFVNMVAPEIKGTDVGKILEGFAPIVHSIEGFEDFKINSVAMEDVVKAIYRECNEQADSASRIRTVYINELGERVKQRPSSWTKALVPFL